MARPLATAFLSWLPGALTTILWAATALVLTEAGAGLDGLKAVLYWSLIVASSLGAGRLIQSALAQRLILGETVGVDASERLPLLDQQATALSFREQFVELTTT